MNKVSTLLYNLAQRSVVIGEIRVVSTETIPLGWHLCDGSVISRNIYNKLFTIYGTTWGGGDGETTFAIPNLSGRTLIGAGESSATGHTNHLLGDLDGEEKHTLSGAEMASHSHCSGCGYNNIAADEKGIVPNNGGNHNSDCSNYSSNTGGNVAHNTMQPYSACQYIIYTGVETYESNE